MKKVVTLLAVLGLGLTLIGCGGDAAPPAKKPDASKPAETKPADTKPVEKH